MTQIKSSFFGLTDYHYDGLEIYHEIIMELFLIIVFLIGISKFKLRFNINKESQIFKLKYDPRKLRRNKLGPQCQEFLKKIPPLVVKLEKYLVKGLSIKNILHCSSTLSENSNN